jgi:hypothetical protein
MYKYATEAGINLWLNEFQICQQDEFNALSKSSDLSTFNIYFICRRHRVSLIPDTVKIEDDNINFTLEVWENDLKFKVNYLIPNTFGSNITIKSDYPYTDFFIIKDGTPIQRYKTAFLIDEFSERFMMVPRPYFADFEILYIGETNKLSKSPTIDRLINHKLLQEIYADNNRQNPDKEIHLVLCSFDQNTDVEYRGSIRTDPAYYDEDEKRFKDFNTNKAELSSKQRVLLSEAALINYFQPIYNTKLKNTFPNKKHSSYDECYKLDLNAVSIEIDTELFFYTDSVKTNNHHDKTFYLQLEEDRRKLFDY